MRKPCVFWMLTLLASSAAAESFMARSLAPEHGVDVFTRAEARRLMDRDLLAEPAGSALYGAIDVYDRFPWVESHWIAVTSDARWQRLLYGAPGDAPRAFGSADMPIAFGEPRGLAFAPDGRLFVTDRTEGRLVVLRLDRSGAEPRLVYASHVDGLVQPLDVAVHDGGTPLVADDDRVLVVEAGEHRIGVFAAEGDRLVKLHEFGARGPGNAEFLSPRTIAIGRTDGACTDQVFVGDSGNHRLVRLTWRDGRLTWDAAMDLPMEATSVDADHHGNLLLTMRRRNDVWKVTPGFEVVAAFAGGARALAAPRDIAIPFAWVHDHRPGGAGPAWRGEGSALVLEAWKDASGVRLVDLGVEIGSLRRSGNAELELQLTDPAHASAEITQSDGRIVRHDLGTLAAGTQNIAIPGLDGAARVTLAAVSLYDAGRQASKTLVLEDTAPPQVVLHGNVPNPFNPMTTISFALPAAGRAALTVFDAKGRRVRELWSGTLPAGTHEFVWDGRDTRGRAMPSGVYFGRLQALEASIVRKMVMAR